MNPAESPILFLTLTSSAMPLNKLNEYADTDIAQRISMIQGVAQVMVMGQQKYAVRVKVNPDKAAERGIGINEVANALRTWNVNSPVGTLWGERQAMNITTTGQLFNGEQFAGMTVAFRNGAPVYLRDIAQVVDSVEDERSASWLYQNGQHFRTITLLVQRQPGANVIDVNNAVKRVLPQIEKRMPPSVHLQIRGDQSKTIREAFQDVQLTMTITIGLVILVIALFSRAYGRATLIPSLRCRSRCWAQWP
jgi:HAE1 family hydrophobic/amphiphilic exporter-1